MMRVLFWKEYREHRSIWLARLSTVSFAARSCWPENAKVAPLDFSIP